MTIKKLGRPTIEISTKLVELLSASPSVSTNEEAADVLGIGLSAWKRRLKEDASLDAIWAARGQGVKLPSHELVGVFDDDGHEIRFSFSKRRLDNLRALAKAHKIKSSAMVRGLLIAAMDKDGTLEGVIQDEKVRTANKVSSHKCLDGAVPG